MTGGHQVLVGSGGGVIGGTLPIVNYVAAASSSPYSMVRFGADGIVYGLTKAGTVWTKRWCQGGAPTSFWHKVTITGGNAGVWGNDEYGLSNGVWIQLNVNRDWYLSNAGFPQTTNITFNYWYSASGSDATIMASGNGEVRLQAT